MFSFYSKAGTFNQFYYLPPTDNSLKKYNIKSHFLIKDLQAKYYHKTLNSSNLSLTYIFLHLFYKIKTIKLLTFNDK